MYSGQSQCTFRTRSWARWAGSPRHSACKRAHRRSGKFPARRGCSRCDLRSWFCRQDRGGRLRSGCNIPKRTGHIPSAAYRAGCRAGMPSTRCRPCLSHSGHMRRRTWSGLGTRSCCPGHKDSQRRCPAKLQTLRLRLTTRPCVRSAQLARHRAVVSARCRHLSPSGSRCSPPRLAHFSAVSASSSASTIEGPTF